MTDVDGAVQLSVDGLVAGYGRAVVLQGVHLELRRGEVVGVAGPNGVGKTTLLRALTGLVRRTAGPVSLDGVPVPAHPVGAARLGIAHVPEGRRLFANLSVRENLRIGAIAGRVDDRGDAVDAACDRFPAVREFLPRRAGLLSGGQQQMVAVARGLVAEPRLLLIDELSLGLSPRAADEITAGAVAACRASGTTLVVVDQNLRLLARHCERLEHLHEGTLRPLSVEGARSGAAIF